MRKIIIIGLFSFSIFCILTACQTTVSPPKRDQKDLSQTAPVQPRIKVVLPSDAGPLTKGHYDLIKRGLYLTKNGLKKAIPAKYSKQNWSPTIERPKHIKAVQTNDVIVIPLRNELVNGK